MTRQQLAEQAVARWWNAHGLGARLSEETRNSLIREVVEALAETAAAEQAACAVIADEMKGTSSQFGPLHAVGLAEAAEIIAERIRARGN